MSSPEKLKMSVTEFEAFALAPENADRHLEFIAGEVIETVVANSYPAIVTARITILLGMYILQNKLGELTSAEGGYKVGNGRFMPDVGFIAAASHPQLPRETWISKAPDLAVEVISPTDKRKDVDAKTAGYLKAGTEVWVVDPDAKTLELYIPGQPVKVYGINDTLNDSHILPEFELVIKKIFP